MGYNLERLKRQYGVGASKQGYYGTTDADRAAYDKYSDEYLLRLQNTPMYSDELLYDSILSGPEYEEVVSPITGPVDPAPITTPVVTPGSGINGGGDGEGQRQRDRAAGIGVYVPQLHPYDSEQAKLMREYNKQGEYPFWDQVGLDINEAIDNYKTSGGIFGALGKGISNIFNGTEVDPGPKITTITPAMSSAFPRGGVTNTSIPDFYNDAVALDPIPSNLGGYQLGMGYNTGTPYDANEFSGTGMTTGAAPMGVALNSGMGDISGLEAMLDKEDAFNAQAAVDAQAAIDTQAVAAQQLSNAADNAKFEQEYQESLARIEQEAIRQSIQEAAVPVRVRNNKQRSTVNSGGNGTGAAQRSGGYGKSKAPGESGSRFGLAQGGHIKGYAMGGAPNFGEEIATIEDLDEATDLEVLADEATGLEMLATQAKQMSQPSDRANELMTMLQNNTANPNSYSAQLATEQGSYNEAAVAFQDMITKMADNQSKGPDESEKWFRLAAAFGAPTKSGHFTENLGLASSELADISAERRTAGAAGDALKMQGAQFGLELLKEQMQNTSSLAAEERQENKDTQKMLLEWQRENDLLLEERTYDLAVLAGEREYDGGKPTTEAGRLAVEMGNPVGSVGYESFVRKWYSDKQAKDTLELEALTNAANQLTNAEITQLEKTDSTLQAADTALTLLARAHVLNKTAYTNEPMDKLMTGLDGVFSPDSQEYKDTKELELVLQQVAVAQLKATFGGAGITDGERKALEALQGIDLKDKVTRNTIIEAAIRAMRKIEIKKQKHRKSIMNRTAYKVTKPGAEE